MAQKILKRKKRPFTEDEQWHAIKCPTKRKNILRFQRSRCQAKFRNETWDFTYEEWEALWGDKIDMIGRESDSYCMRRYDEDKSWCTSNCYVLPRNQMLSDKLTDYWTNRRT